MRSRLGVVLLLVFVLGSSVHAWIVEGQKLAQAPIGRDRIAYYDEKFAQLRQRLAPGAEVGYARNEPPELERSRVFNEQVDAHTDVVVEFLKTRRVLGLAGLDPITVKDLVVYVVRRLERMGPVPRRDPDREKVRQVVRDILQMQYTIPAFAVAYALAPALLRVGGDTELVVGDFPPAYDYTELARRQGLVVVEDFGNGAVLFRVGAR